MWKLMLVGVLAVLAGCAAESDPKSNDNMIVVITNNDANAAECPVCAMGEVCVDGFCQIEGCEPVCEGASCGPNGCGGMCNPCEGRAQCIDGACENPPMDCSGFAQEATAWALPQLFEDEQFDYSAGSANNCGSGNGVITHQLADLTGSGRQDLVLTNKCDAGGVGTLRWEIFENTGSGFATQPKTWSLPQLFEDEQFERFSDVTSKCGAMDGRFAHVVIDLTGDGKPELVLTDKCDAGGVGTTRWEVFANTGSGFADTPTSWAIPQLFEDEQFEFTAETASKCGSGSGVISHALMDLTGDGRPDLVLTNKCDAGGVGTTRWEVFENTGSGFAANPTSWAIPQLFEDEQFEHVGGSTSKCGSGQGVLSHTVMDMDADGLPDLVLTNRCDTGGVGTTRWEYYRNQGDGFAAEPTSFGLPRLFEDDQFDQVAGSSSKCGSGSGTFSHFLTDLDGNDTLDLVLTNRCDSGGVGTTRWDIHSASCN